MRLGYLSLGERGAGDLLAVEVADRLARRGVRLAGAVQTNRARPGEDDCDMDMHVLPDGPTIRISQDLGPGSEACRLDAGALEQAAAEAAARVAGAAALFAKFGKHEAAGGGFRPLMAEALDHELPVLVSVSPACLADFLDFAGGLGEPLPPDPDAIARWLFPAPIPA